MVERFRDQNDLTVVGFARMVGASESAIRAIIREDTSRFAAGKRDRLLAKLGITLAEWYRE
jgi:plasmid maintenance system antidote protein VapI